MEKAAPVGLWMVCAAQVAYILASFTSGDIGLGTVADAASAGCAAVCASALSRSDRNAFAWGLVVFAIVQLIDLVVTFFTRGVGSFFLAFIVVVIGLAVAATSALAWRKQPADAPRPQGVRMGAAILSLGNFGYLVAGFLSGATLGLFPLGGLASGIGWALVALL